jgi:hypothetical protein
MRPHSSGVSAGGPGAAPKRLPPPGRPPITARDHAPLALPVALAPHTTAPDYTCTAPPTSPPPPPHPAYHVGYGLPRGGGVAIAAHRVWRVAGASNNQPPAAAHVWALVCRMSHGGHCRTRGRMSAEPAVPELHFLFLVSVRFWLRAARLRLQKPTELLRLTPRRQSNKHTLARPPARPSSHPPNHRARARCGVPASRVVQATGTD